MDSKTVLTQAEELIKPYADHINWAGEERIDVYLPKDKLVAAVKALIDVQWGYISAITGVDVPAKPAVVDQTSGAETKPATEGGIELIYTICNGAAITNLRVMLPYSDLSIDTICHLVPSVSLFEREIIEILGVTFNDTPNTEHLILPDSWPQGVYPLRKSFTGLNEPPAGQA